MVRLRITYSKNGAMRYTSNLDVHKIWERTLRRARLPLAYSQGFHPQPRLAQACPLPLGLTSLVEMIDFWLETDPPVEEVLAALRPALPPGLEVHSIQLVDPREPALPTQVSSADYIATLLDPVDNDELAQRVQAMIAAPDLWREWRNKKYNLRPLIEHLEILPPDELGRARLAMRLATREGATGRSEQVFTALGYDPFDVRVERIKLNFS
jgi:radical SAM-linked protein